MSAGPQLSDEQRFDWLRLLRSEGIGPRTFHVLVNRYGSARAALAALPTLAGRSRSARVASEDEIAREFTEAGRCGARFVAIGEADYPPLLRRIDSAPPLIAMRGNAAIFMKPAVAIVGARNASGAGLAFAERLARGLAQAGFAIVSGLARGIDIRAHQATLETGTIAVLAGGHDKVYPPEHAPILDKLIGQGAILSEMPFGWEARGRDFPRRNRLVSGLAQGIVVVEAARKSGSLITARFAAEQGRDVFAVPGSPLDPRAEGTNDLLRDGASICTSAQDVIDALSRQIELPDRPRLAEPGDDEPLWDELDLPEIARAPKTPQESNGDPRPKNSERAERTERSAASPDGTMQSRIIALLGPAPISIDELARAADMPAGQLRAVLLELELAGQLERQDGDLVSRV